MHLDDIRREYVAEGLSEDSAPTNPFTLFETWMKQAIDAEFKDPTAMTLATVDGQGAPSQRIVLLKAVEQDSFVFFTNYGSNKAEHIEQNNQVSLHFPWHAIERQIKVLGRAEKISTAESLRYFVSRPRESQLAAWASRQSHRINSRQFLMSQFESMKAKFQQGDVPLPDFWGGYRVKPVAIEFWQGRENRLHDRLEYMIDGQQQWQLSRLAP